MHSNAFQDRFIYMIIIETLTPPRNMDCSSKVSNIILAYILVLILLTKPMDLLVSINGNPFPANISL